MFQGKESLPTQFLIWDFVYSYFQGRKEKLSSFLFEKEWPFHIVERFGEDKFDAFYYFSLFLSCNFNNEIINKILNIHTELLIFLVLGMMQELQRFTKHLKNKINIY